MTSRLWGSGSSLGHTEAWEILPWYVNGSLEGEELEKIERHLTDCERCRQEVAYLHRLTQALVGSEARVPAPDPALRETLSRIETLEAEKPEAIFRNLRDAVKPGRLWRPLLALQALLILILGIALWQRSHEAAPGFRTLSRPAQAVPSSGLMVRMVFSPDLREEDLRQLLHEFRGQIVEGPSPYGVYRVEIRSLSSPDAQASVLEEIRAREEVEFLEPLQEQR